MTPTNGKVLLRCDVGQKSSINIGGLEFSTATKFETNYREKSPVIATVVGDSEFLNDGDVLLCHHNLFYLPSPYHLEGDLFSIPLSKVLFFKIQADGNLQPICGNLLCKRIPEKHTFDLPPSQQKFLISQYEVIDGGWTKYKKGDIIFTRPVSGYEVVYILNGIEYRQIKVDSDMICGILK